MKINNSETADKQTQYNTDILSSYIVLPMCGS